MAQNMKETVDSIVAAANPTFIISEAVRNNVPTSELLNRIVDQLRAQCRDK